jgi:hypothetical protein
MLDLFDAEGKKMTAQHFSELFHTIIISTKSNKKSIRKHLGVSQPALDRYLREGIQGRMKFLILDRLGVYLFQNLGGGEAWHK